MPTRGADAGDQQALGQHLAHQPRPRVAPSDERIASSLARSVARANCMFITLTQAMSSTPTQNAEHRQQRAAQRRAA